MLTFAKLYKLSKTTECSDMLNIGFYNNKIALLLATNTIIRFMFYNTFVAFLVNIEYRRGGEIM